MTARIGKQVWQILRLAFSQSGRQKDENSLTRLLSYLLGRFYGFLWQHLAGRLPSLAGLNPRRFCKRRQMDIVQIHRDAP